MSVTVDVDAGGAVTVDVDENAGGPAGGVLSGNYPDPGFAVPMATEAELTAHEAAHPAHPASGVSVASGAGVTATDVQAAIAQIVGFITSQEAGDSAAIAAVAAGLADEITRATAQELLKLAKSANLSDLANAATARTNLGLGSVATHPASDFDTAGAAAAAQAASQPLDSDLTAIAALSTTVFGRALLALADAAAGRSALGLGSAATQPSSAFDPAGAATAAAAALVNSSPATLDTLKELADALGDDPNFATTTATALGTKVDTAGAGLVKTGTTMRRAASTTGYANLAALPTASAHTGEQIRTTDGGIYESDGASWLVIRDPTGTYASPAQGRPNSHLACVIGDSNTQLPGNAGTPSFTQHDGWFPQMCIRSRQAIRNGGSFAVTGAHVSDVLSVQVPLVTALTGSAKPSVCFILAGTNDCWANSGTTFDIDASTASYLAIVAALRAVGIIPVVCLIPPNNGNAQTNSNTQRWNRRLRELIDRYGLVGPVDFYTPLVSAAGGFNTAYLLADGNGVHANNLGHRAMSEYALNVEGIDELFPPPVLCTSKESADPTNIFLTGTLAQGLYLDTTGWTATGDTGNGTVSTVAPAPTDDLVGNWHQTRYTGTSTYTRQTGSVVPTAAIASHRLAFAGRIRIAGVEAAIAAGATGAVVTVRAAYKDVSSVVISYIVALNAWSVDVADGTFYAELDMPANAVGLRIEIVVGPATAATPIVVQVGELTIRDLTAMGVLA